MNRCKYTEHPPGKHGSVTLTKTFTVHSHCCRKSYNFLSPSPFSDLLQSPVKVIWKADMLLELLSPKPLCCRSPHRSPWTWHLVQAYITQSEVMVWLSPLTFLITVDQTLLSDQIIYLAWHTEMIRLVGEIPSICSTLACMGSDREPKNTPPRTPPFFHTSDELFKFCNFTGRSYRSGGLLANESY